MTPAVSVWMAEAIHVLLVEDDRDQGLLIHKWLESVDGCHVVRAVSGDQAEIMLRVRDWDLIVTDIELPGQSGLELLRICKEISPSTPTLLITGHGTLDYAHDALHLGADEFLLKPLVRGPFLEKVIALTRRSAKPGQRRTEA
jgi:DNA-binding NtrC family response regulator